MLEKGCNTTAWIKAKPEWAKGAQLIRITPRFNPDVNGYWMCDIGRFDYHWIEGDDRLQQPLVRNAAGALAADGLARPRWPGWPTGSPPAAARPALRFLVSAHASHEELFLFGRLAGDCSAVPETGVAVSWRRRDKPQPPNAKFKVPAVDAPNVNGARDMGCPGEVGYADGSADVLGVPCRRSRHGRVSALYVFDPGADGYIGDIAWIVDGEAVGQAAAAGRAGRADDRAGQGGRHRAARRRVGREGRRLRRTTRGGCRVPLA